MKNTNKNMLYTFWSGAILLCLALVAVVLVFTNAVGNTHTSKPKDDPAAAVTPTPTPQVNPITPIQSSASLAQTEDKGSTYVDQIYFLGDKSLKVLQAESMLTGADAKKQVWVPDTGSLPASSLDTAKYKSPVTGNNVPADEICEVNKPAYLVICPSADNISMTNEEQIKSVYTTLINAVKAKSPSTKIICCSLTPIASNYQYEDITNELIQKVNGWIAAAAESAGAKYLDMASGLVADDGFLPQSYQDGDGMHLNAAGMKAWLTYLRTHAYPRPICRKPKWFPAAKTPGAVAPGVSYIKKASQSFAAAAAKKSPSIFSGDMCGGENTSQAASVEFVRRRRTNYARSRL